MRILQNGLSQTWVAIKFCFLSNKYFFKASTNNNTSYICQGSHSELKHETPGRLATGAKGTCRGCSSQGVPGWSVTQREVKAMLAVVQVGHCQGQKEKMILFTVHSCPGLVTSPRLSEFDS